MEVLNTLEILVFNSNVTAVLVFLICFLVLYLSMRKPAGIPPGPSFTLPVLGDTPLLIGQDMIQTFRKLRKKYGDIFSFYMGKEHTIIISGYKFIHEAAVKKGMLFSDRPTQFMNSLEEKRLGILMANGPFWKEQRKFAHSVLQEFGFGKSSFEAKILEEVKCFTKVLSAKNGHPVDIRGSIHASVSNVLFSTLCGKHYQYDDEVYQELLHRLDKIFRIGLQVSVTLSVAPCLQHLPGDLFNIKWVKGNVKRFNEYFSELYEEHKVMFNPKDCRDFIDHFIKEMEANDSEANTSFTLKQLCFILADLFGAGTETTATALRWAILFLLNYPDIQQKLHTEIDNVISNDRLPSLNDKPKLPYIEAFTMEVLRFSNIAPVSVPHAVSQEKDVMLNGYRLPKGVTVWFNLDSVLFDSDIFHNPMEFNPDRFLDSDDNVIRPKELIPFGIGRRLCLGEALAKMELFLYLTTLIQKFEFKPPVGKSAPEIKGVLGMTFAPQLYEVRAIAR